MHNPPKYPSIPHWPFSETIHRDDTLHKYAGNFLKKDIIITEKIDGGNTCLWNGNVYARSTVSPSTAGWMAMVKKHHGWKTNREFCKNLVFYGEDIYGVHSIEYGPVHESETYYLFGVRDEDTFLSWEQVCYLASILEIKTVPLVAYGMFSSMEELTNFLRMEIKKPSVLGGAREGFVIRTTGDIPAGVFGLHMCKYVRKGHVQTDEHWTKNWKPCKIIERI